MASPVGIAGVFDRAADTYDNVGVPWFGPIAEGLVDQLAVRPGEQVLDIGCGSGAALMPLAHAAGPTGSVLGVDLAPRMVARAGRAAADLPHVAVRVADARAPDLPPSSFDVVAASLVLFFLPDPAAAVHTWTQLLVGGGRLGVATFGPQDERWKQIDSVFTPYLPPTMLDARTSGRRGPFASDRGVEQLLDGAGLDEVRTAHRTVRAVFRDTDHLLEFSWSHGQRAMWEAVPEEHHALLRRQVGEAVHRLGAGPLSFDQDVRYTVGRRP